MEGFFTETHTTCINAPDVPFPLNPLSFIDNINDRNKLVGINHEVDPYTFYTKANLKTYIQIIIYYTEQENSSYFTCGSPLKCKINRTVPLKGGAYGVLPFARADVVARQHRRQKEEQKQIT